MPSLLPPSGLRCHPPPSLALLHGVEQRPAAMARHPRLRARLRQLEHRDAGVDFGHRRGSRRHIATDRREDIRHPRRRHTRPSGVWHTWPTSRTGMHRRYRHRQWASSVHRPPTRPRPFPAPGASGQPHRSGTLRQQRPHTLAPHRLISQPIPLPPPRHALPMAPHRYHRSHQHRRKHRRSERGNMKIED